FCVAAAQVYPVGIPFLYAVILWKNRELLNPRIDTHPCGIDETPTTGDSASGSKGPDLYYYEVIECGRRILLTGVLIFISPHTATQSAMACIFAFASL
ncbi:unnamed protein product, partial [Laminaria digitata]